MLFWSNFSKVAAGTIIGCMACLSCQSNAESPIDSSAARHFVPIDHGAGLMAKAPGLCYYAIHYPKFQGREGTIFIGQINRIIEEEEARALRYLRCKILDDYECWFDPIAEVSVESIVSGKTLDEGTIFVRIGPIRHDEAEKWFTGSRVLVFGRSLSDVDPSYLGANIYAIFFLQDGEVKGTSRESLKYDFGDVAVSETEFVTRVRELVGEPEDGCDWNEYARRRSLQGVNQGVVFSAEVEFGPRR